MKSIACLFLAITIFSLSGTHVKASLNPALCATAQTKAWDLWLQALTTDIWTSYTLWASACAIELTGCCEGSKCLCGEPGVQFVECPCNENQFSEACASLGLDFCPKSTAQEIANKAQGCAIKIQEHYEKQTQQKTFDLRSQLVLLAEGNQIFEDCQRELEDVQMKIQNSIQSKMIDKEEQQ